MWTGAVGALSRLVSPLQSGRVIASTHFSPVCAIGGGRGLSLSISRRTRDREREQVAADGDDDGWV